jgi:uncharacterized membrane protein
MKRAQAAALPVAIGVVAGMRSMTAPALLSWAAKRRVVRIGDSALLSFAVGQLSQKAINGAIAELVADKLPFVPERTRPGPLAWRAAMGAVSGAAVASAMRNPAWEGAAAGVAGAMLGAFAGKYLRKRAARSIPQLTAAVLEDALALALGAAVVWQISRSSAK